MEGMKEFPDKFFDLAIVDVPYGLGVANGKSFRGNKPHKSWAGRESNMVIYEKKEWDNQAPPAEYFDELFRVSNNQIIWGANHFISKIPYDSSCWIVWDKQVTDNSADCELAWTSFDTAVRKFDWLWNGYKKHKPESRIHPTQKPIALYKWLLSNYASLGDKILDTHMGSQSSRIAAFDMGFDYWGYEIDKDYFEDGCKRFEVFKSQLKLEFA